MNELDLLDVKKSPDGERSPLRMGQNVLFRHGVQIRLSFAILLVIFSAVFPLIALYGFPYLLVLWEIFLTLPLAYGLFVMARRATDGEAVTMYLFFSAFSRRYFYALTTMLGFVILMGLPLLLPIGAVIGAYALAEWVAEAVAAGFVPAVILLGYALAIPLLFPALLLQIFAYFFASIRVRNGSTPFFKAIGTSFRLLKRRIFAYLKLRMQLLLLDLISVVSVFALFPIYTLPLYLCINASYLDLLTEKEKNREANPYLTAYSNNYTINED